MSEGPIEYKQRPPTISLPGGASQAPSADPLSRVKAPIASHRQKVVAEVLRLITQAQDIFHKDDDKSWTSIYAQALEKLLEIHPGKVVGQSYLELGLLMDAADSKTLSGPTDAKKKKSAILSSFAKFETVFPKLLSLPKFFEAAVLDLSQAIENYKKTVDFEATLDSLYSVTATFELLSLLNYKSPLFSDELLSLVNYKSPLFSEQQFQAYFYLARCEQILELDYSRSVKKAQHWLQKLQSTIEPEDLAISELSELIDEFIEEFDPKKPPVLTQGQDKIREEARLLLESVKSATARSSDHGRYVKLLKVKANLESIREPISSDLSRSCYLNLIFFGNRIIENQSRNYRQNASSRRRQLNELFKAMHIIAGFVKTLEDSSAHSHELRLRHACCLLNKAVILGHLKNYQQAHRLFTKAVAIFSQLGEISWASAAWCLDQASKIKNKNIYNQKLAEHQAQIQMQINKVNTLVALIKAQQYMASYFLKEKSKAKKSSSLESLTDFFPPTTEPLSVVSREKEIQAAKFHWCLSRETLKQLSQTLTSLDNVSVEDIWSDESFRTFLYEALKNVDAQILLALHDKNHLEHLEKQEFLAPLQEEYRSLMEIFLLAQTSSDSMAAIKERLLSQLESEEDGSKVEDFPEGLAGNFKPITSVAEIQALKGLLTGLGGDLSEEEIDSIVKKLIDEENSVSIKKDELTKMATKLMGTLAAERYPEIAAELISILKELAVFETRDLDWFGILLNKLSLLEQEFVTVKTEEADVPSEQKSAKPEQKTTPDKDESSDDESSDNEYSKDEAPDWLKNYLSADPSELYLSVDAKKPPPLPTSHSRVQKLSLLAVNKITRRRAAAHRDLRNKKRGMTQAAQPQDERVSKLLEAVGVYTSPSMTFPDLGTGDENLYLTEIQQLEHKLQSGEKPSNITDKERRAYLTDVSSPEETPTPFSLTSPNLEMGGEELYFSPPLELEQAGSKNFYFHHQMEILRQGIKLQSRKKVGRPTKERWEDILFLKGKKVPAGFLSTSNPVADIFCQGSTGNGLWLELNFFDKKIKEQLAKFSIITFQPTALMTEDGSRKKRALFNHNGLFYDPRQFGQVHIKKERDSYKFNYQEGLVLYFNNGLGIDLEQNKKPTYVIEITVLVTKTAEGFDFTYTFKVDMDFERVLISLFGDEQRINLKGFQEKMTKEQVITVLEQHILAVFVENSSSFAEGVVTSPTPVKAPMKKPEDTGQAGEGSKRKKNESKAGYVMKGRFFQLPSSSSPKKQDQKKPPAPEFPPQSFFASLFPGTSRKMIPTSSSTSSASTVDSAVFGQKARSSHGDVPPSYRVLATTALAPAAGASSSSSSSSSSSAVATSHSEATGALSTPRIPLKGVLKSPGSAHNKPPQHLQFGGISVQNVARYIEKEAEQLSSQQSIPGQVKNGENEENGTGLSSAASM